MPYPAVSGITLTVGSGQQYTTLEAAILAASSGDTIEVHAGTYAGSYVEVTKDLTIKGIGSPTITYNGGTGPFIRLVGDNRNIKISDVNFVGTGVNTAILGEGNVAYGPQLPGANQIWHLIDVNISNAGGGTLYGAKATTLWDIQGGSHTASAAAAIISIADAGQVSVTPSPTGIGTSFATNDEHGLVGRIRKIVVKGANFAVPSTMYGIQLWTVDVTFGSVSDNSFSSTVRQLAYNTTDITGSYPNPFQILNGTVSAVSALGPDDDQEHWLAF
jgi:hypothetical protein